MKFPMSLQEGETWSRNFFTFHANSYVLSSRGMERTYEAPSNEAPHMILGYHQGRLVTYLQRHFNFFLRQWQPAKPRTGMSFFKQSSNQTFSFPFDVTSLTVRFSQSELPLSFEDEWAASERVVWFPSHCFSPLIFQLFLSGFTEVFLHVRCIPHQNSQRCFWASVWGQPLYQRPLIRIAPASKF